MLVSKIDYNLINDIMRLKDTVKQSVDSVMEGALTATHLASDVYALLDELDKLEQSWRATPPTDEAVQPGQPVQAPPPAAPVQEVPPAAAETPAEQAPSPAAPVQEAQPEADLLAEQAPLPAEETLPPAEEVPPAEEALPVEEIPAEEEVLPLDDGAPTEEEMPLEEEEFAG